MLYKELVYIILDEAKLPGDDNLFNENHVIFLCKKYRTLLLEKKYNEAKRNKVSESNYQTICLNLELANAVDGEPCTGGVYLRSKEQIPNTVNIGSPIVSPVDYFQGNFCYVSKERMRFIGYNKFLKNIIYCAIGTDGHLYFKSNNIQHKYLETAKFSAVFEDADEASKLECNEGEENCDIMDKKFPLEEGLVNMLIEVVVKELKTASASPNDDKNDASDDLSTIHRYIELNMKNKAQKELTN